MCPLKHRFTWSRTHGAIWVGMREAVVFWNVSRQFLEYEAY